MPDRCEVLPGDSVVARRGAGLLWVDAPGSPALVAALHACLGVSGSGADRVLAAVAGQVGSLAHGAASFALVLGRRPDNHEMVTSGGARAVPIADTQNVLSSAHAALQRSGREVSLVDLGSLNGTHVAGPEATEWTQLEPGVAHPLSDGDRLLLGWTVITFEQSQE